MSDKEAKQVATQAFETAGDGWTSVTSRAQIINRPARSTTLVEGLHGASISPLDPTATMVSPSTAIALTNPPAAECEAIPRPCSIREGHVIWNPATRPETGRCDETSHHNSRVHKYTPAICTARGEDTSVNR